MYYYDQAGNLLKTLPPAAVQPNYSPTFFTSVAAARAAGTDLTNGTNIESLATQYRYNTLNQVIAQQSPDGGKSQFWYDRLGRLAVSQNAKQAGDPSYSYTLYDALGRITEVGQKPQTTAMTQTISQDTTALPNWLNNLTTGSAKVQITRTVYDVPYIGIGVGSYMTGVNLRNRVAYSMVIDADNTSSPPYRAATFYSYDPHGNVDTLLQDYGTSGVMSSANNRFKLMAYNYDLISGKVNQVSYQPRQADAFYHQYSYDAENRITSVRTSTDSIEWQNDAAYTYYRHGPLARTEIGDLQLQGIDYAYTVQGWLKSINPSWVTLAGSTDQYDSDGVATPALFERDAYKLNLNYFDDGTYTDFMPIAPNPGYVQGNGLPSGGKRNLYNGNIGSMGIDIRALATSGARDAGPMLYNYGYDQLNRITKMDAWNANGSFRPIGTSALTDYAERYSYDPNGNILTLNRNGDSAHTSMDQLSYKYVYAKTGGGTGEYVPGSAPTTGVDHLTNQLSSIQDAVTGNTYGGDIKNQSAFNYQYDAIGELTDDDTAKIHNITWNVYGKLLSLSDSGNTISYTYDPTGNRISKLAHGITTWYVRDAQGNVMSVYTQGNSVVHGDSLTQTEAHVYGSSRLGLLNLSVNCATTLAQPTLRSLVRGGKLFELTNHLGNVLATISDKKIQHSSDSTTVAYYTADVINANDYYSFGMPMPVRSYAAGSSANYRYGFNGKENDNEVKGVGNEIDYGQRIYDPRIGKFLSVDPLIKKFPWYTPYEYAGNKPIWRRDLEGMQVEGEEDIKDKEELIDEENKREELIKLGKALRSPTPEEIDKERKGFDDEEKEDPGKVAARRRGLLEKLGNYTRNGFDATQASYGGLIKINTAIRQFNVNQDQIRVNQQNGQAFEGVVTTALKNSTSGQVARQVTLLVAGQLNGQNVSVRIRIDNITNTDGVLNLYEAKYSVEQITGANFTRTMTPNQQTAFDIFTSGTNVNIFVRGNGARDLQIPSGTNITGKLGDIKVLVNNTQGGQHQEVKTINVPAKLNFQNNKD